MNSSHLRRRARGPSALCWLCALLCALVLSGCRGEAGPLTDNQIPSIVLLEPLDGASFALGSPVEMLAQASDPDGGVARVVFHVGDEEAVSASAPPYRHSFTPAAAGSYRLTARAYDDQNVSGLPASVTVRVLEPELLFTLSVGVTGAGRVLSEPGGVACPGTCQAEFALGAPVTLSAVSADGVDFGGWGDACAAATGDRCTLSRDAPETVRVSATFAGETPEEVRVTLFPDSATLRPGEEKLFTAAVTGSEAGVTWSATGGSVAGTGLEVRYTAPDAPGSYALTATSAEDQDERGTAAITVSSAPPDADAPFAIVALPDTQNYICSTCTHAARPWRPEVFAAQTQWVVDHLDERNIAFVTHLGDIVNCANYGVRYNGNPCNPDGKDEWAAAEQAMSVLDGKVPYSVAIGDHEYFPEQHHSGDYANYVRHFGAERYQGYDWYGGAGPRELSHYQLFGAGGYTFLHIALEWEAPDDALEWAQRVTALHPGKPTIVTVHGYLNDGLYEGGRSCGDNTCTPVPSSDQRNYRQRSPDSRDCPGDGCVANSPEAIFKTFIEPNPQIFMVLGGHYHGPSGLRYMNPPSNYGELYQVSANAEGLPVYEMLSNFQDYAAGGQGFLRVITFKPGAGENGQDRIFVETYSPTLDMFQRDDMGTRSASEFYFDLDFSARFAAGAP